MSISHYRGFSTEILLRWKRDLEYEASNWNRRIKEQHTRKFDPIFQTVTEYKNRIRDCRRSIKQIDKVLAERGMV